MHKKIIFIVLGFFILNIFSINAFYNNYLGRDLYNKKDYVNSIKDFQKAGDKEGYYNIANSFYKEKKYEVAIKEYKSILTEEKNEINFNINHNIANSFYRIGELEKDNTRKIKNWEESIKYYSNALNIIYDEQTKKNLEFVLKKIKEVKKQENKKQENSKDGQNEKEQDSKSGKQSGKGESKNNSNGKGGKEKKDQEGSNGENTDKKEGSENKDGKSGSDGKESENKKGKTGEKTQKQEGNKGEKSNELSSNQEEALKKYEQGLKEEQRNNADNFNKVYKEDNSNDPFTNFFNDPFFNNNLLNGGSGKKDW